MRVIVNPGTYSQEEKELSRVMRPDNTFRDGQATREMLGELIALLVEKGVLTLDDCSALGGPSMEEKS